MTLKAGRRRGLPGEESHRERRLERIYGQRHWQSHGAGSWEPDSSELTLQQKACSNSFGTKPCHESFGELLACCLPRLCPGLYRLKGSFGPRSRSLATTRSLWRPWALSRFSRAKIAEDRPHTSLYQGIDAVLKDLVAAPEARSTWLPIPGRKEDITFIDDPNWDQSGSKNEVCDSALRFPEVGQALKPHATLEERQMA